MLILWIGFIICLILLIFMWQIYNLHKQRREVYLQALDMSIKSKKPLLVIGDPFKGLSCGLFGAPYGLGDICIDLEPITEGVIQADMFEYLKKLPNNSYVIFISCVLEYIPQDLNPIIQEIYRVASSIFVVHVQWHNYITRYGYNYQGDKQYNLIISAPPNSREIIWQKN
jgi:hypothetical protein